MDTKIIPPQNLYKKIGISFIVLTLILVIAVVYFSFSEATINIKSAQEKISVEFVARVMPQEALAGYSGTTEAVAGGIYSTTVRGRQTFQVSGGKVGEAQATGQVTIINNYSKAQPLVATTRLLTPNGLLFRLSKRVDVPAGGRVKVEVYADQPGKQGEIGPTRFTIPGLWPGLQDKIYAESSEPMTGGVKEIKAVTQEDVDKGVKELTDNLYQKAIEELEKQEGKKLDIAPENIIKEIFDQKFSAKAGEEVNEFTIEMSLKIIAVTVDQEAMISLAEKKLKDSMSADKDLGGIDPRSLHYSVERYDLKNQAAEIKVYLEGGAALREDSLILNKDKIVGLSKKEAEDYFKSFSVIESVEIKFSPFWVQKIPKLRDHIKINIIE